jgi:hypothetical protein
MAAARRTLATQPKPSGIPASPNVLDPAIPLKPLRPRREHVSYVSAQVRGHLRLPAVGKSDELHNLDMTTRVGAEASDTLKYFSERLPSTFVYSGIGLDRGPCWPAPAATRSPAGSPSSRPARSPPGQEWAALVAALEGSLRLYHHKTAPSSRSRTTCTAAPAG